MKRDILTIRRRKMINGCCPAHDDWPSETYRNRASVHTRSRDKKKEHRYFRRTTKQYQEEEE